MSDLRQRISQFFRTELDPTVDYTKPNQLIYRIWSIDTIQKTSVESISVDVLPNPEINGTLYTVSVYKTTIVLAMYDDGTILWLDDPLTDVAFEEFMRRESLLNWLPDRPESLAVLLVKTKFAYLLRPHLISNGADIPRPSYRSDAQVSKLSQEVLQEMEEAIEGIADQITSPTLSLKSDGGATLDICVWTQTYGYVFRIRCHLGVDFTFSYGGSRLAEAVGFWVRDL